MMEKSFLNPASLAAPKGYTHVVTARGGRTIYVSGQVAFDEHGELVGRGDLRAQTRQSFENLRRALAEARAAFADVVKINIYVVNYNRDCLPVIREVRREFLTGDDAPASTLVSVSSLFHEDFLVEIEAVAVAE